MHRDNSNDVNTEIRLFTNKTLMFEPTKTGRKSVWPAKEYNAIVRQHFAARVHSRHRAVTFCGLFTQPVLLVFFSPASDRNRAWGPAGMAWLAA
jgi:hypothetical protein